MHKVITIEREKCYNFDILIKLVDRMISNDRSECHYNCIYKCFTSLDDNKIRKTQSNFWSKI